MTARPEYQQLQTALEKSDADMTAAESHGCLCGMACASGKPVLEDWLKEIYSEFDLNNLLVREASQLLVGLYESARQQLNDAEAGFELFLPSDEDNLLDRTEALAEWCQGFTYGLAAGGLKQQAELPADSAEIIRDMTEIARVGLDEEAQDEADEDAYMQLHEYVRMGVLLINEELHPMKQQPSETLH